MVKVLDQHLDPPRYNFEERDASTAENIEQAAERARERWGLGLRPIHNVTRVAENAGAVVMPMSGLAPEIDAISFATRRPVIAMNADSRSACRMRLGIAHEMGHYVCILANRPVTRSQNLRLTGLQVPF